MNISSKDLERYVAGYTTPESSLLKRLVRETGMKTGRGEMLSGHIQGAFLEMFSYAKRPSNILEIGTFTGYSALCLLKGLQAGGKLHTIDIDEELGEIARKYWQEAGVEDQIVPWYGEAEKILPEIDIRFDLVFIDADKVNYSSYYDLVFDKLNDGGIILADNVLYNGEVLLPEHEQSKNAIAIQAFNDKVRNDARVEQLLLPLRDGIMMVRKK